MIATLVWSDGEHGVRRYLNRHGVVAYQFLRIDRKTKKPDLHAVIAVYYDEAQALRVAKSVQLWGSFGDAKQHKFSVEC